MKISRFFGLNSRDVMRQVRQVLGPDALIVSNRSVDGGIEVLATVDGAFDEAAGQAQQPPQQHASQQAPQPATHHAPYQEQTPAVMPPTAYPAPSRPIAAYQSAYAASALPEDEDEAGMMPASAPAAPVRVEIPPLPSAAPVRMEMPPLAPAAPVRMEMPPLQAAPQARAPAMPAVPPVAPQGYARPPAPQQQPMPQQHAAPQPPAMPPAYRA
ncbi:flagellar biosynthesis protein FlhF, partial [Achromobacter sp. 413638]